MKPEEIRNLENETCRDAAQGEQVTCDRGTAGFAIILAEIAAQLAKQNIYLERIALVMEEAHK